MKIFIVDDDDGVERTRTGPSAVRSDLEHQVNHNAKTSHFYHVFSPYEEGGPTCAGKTRCLAVTVSAIRTPLSLLVGNLMVLRLRSDSLLQSDESLAERTPARELSQAVRTRTIVLQSYSNLRIMLDLESVVQLLSTHIPARSFLATPLF